jgi:fructosamine-3-kinase
MLRVLDEKSDLPVPKVIHSEPKMLLMTYIAGSSQITTSVQEHAAELLAALHNVKGDTFGLPQDTLIGSLSQPNPGMDSWVEFFRDYRLLHMARGAVADGRMSPTILQRIEGLADRLGEFLAEPAAPSLIHGDVWTTNVLAKDGKVTGFVDPAVYYAHPEIELAFTTLFGTFGKPFFDRYQSLRPIETGFFETRRDIYNLYPLLVHVRIFGGGYVNSVDGILRKFGF